MIASSGKIGELIAAMTWNEKLGLVSGWPNGADRQPSTNRLIGVGFIPGVTRLGVPALTFTDGSAGVRMDQPTTAMPAPVSLAATFSADLAHEYGQVLGADARARDQDVIFGPMINIARVPQAGRNFETLGEDPTLLSELAVAEIQGIQRQGTIATTKHLAENNQEDQRRTINVNVDERTLHEIELRGFQAAVTRGNTGSVMCSYNSINGRFGCENPILLTDILRDQWGFTGFVVSDYGANHSAARALQAGTDLEFLSTHFKNLQPGIEAGPDRSDFRSRVMAPFKDPQPTIEKEAVPTSDLNAAVRRILTIMNRFGLLAHASTKGSHVLDRPLPAFPQVRDAHTALAVAAQGSVLLKNDVSTLPLGIAGLRSLAVIGPSGRQPLVGGGGSSAVTGVIDREISPLVALRQSATPDSDINFAVGRDLQGVSVPSDALAPTGALTGQHGLLRTDTATGAKQVDPALDLVGTNSLSPGSQATWSGTITAPTSGTYLLAVQTQGTGAALTLDGTPIDTGASVTAGTTLRRTTDGLTNSSVQLRLTAGPHAIAITAAPVFAYPPFVKASNGRVSIRLAWVTPQKRAEDLAAAVAAAQRARTAVVFAYVEGTEGVDQSSLGLPNEQDQLIEAVAAANPRTVVVLNSGYPVLMPWLRNVRAVIDMWYPGQEGGRATANLLTGASVPSGRLPVTFPVREADSPTAASALSYPGVSGQERYSEGIFTGYRWYDKYDIEPLFPFGFGLSYTTFAYSGLTLLPATDRAPPRARFTVTNTGSRAGTEIAQVYSGRLPTNLPTPVKQLAGVAHVMLRPGASQQITVPLDPQSLSYWNVGLHRWVTPGGRVSILVGSSSRTILLRGDLEQMAKP
jgi:beta-glucosidase